MEQEKQEALLEIIDHAGEAPSAEKIFQELGNFLETADGDLETLPRIIERRLADAELHLRSLSQPLWKKYRKECGEKVRNILANEKKVPNDSPEE